jgi:hypothetical protein
MSKPVDTTLEPQYFQRFPVRVHKDEHIVKEGSGAAVKMFESLVPEKDTRSHGAVGPYGDAYALSFPEGDTEKTKLAGEIIEALWMYDGEWICAKDISFNLSKSDIIEALPHDEAALEHATVKQMLAGDKNGATPGKKTLMTSIFRDARDRMMAIDPKGSPWMIGILRQYLTEYDGNDKTYNDIKEYVTFRTLNVGFGSVVLYSLFWINYETYIFSIMSGFLQWTTDIYLNDEESEITKDFYIASGQVMALTNGV